jgi:hypothetical protein
VASRGTTTDRDPRAGGLRRPWVFGLLLLVLLALFAFNVRHWLFLGDDCFISFRYADHLVRGEGLVWNPGERVEGYTNFLWVLLMAGSLAAGIAPESSSVVIGIASGAGLLAALLVFSAGRWGWDSPFLWVAPFALALSRSFAAWCSGGLETMFFTLVGFGGVLALLRERESKTSCPVVSSLLFAAATLTRPDGGVLALVAGLFHLGEILLRRRSLRSGICWLIPYVVVVGAHLLWRHAYYDAWLPNSFYAKVPGAWWEQGWRYLSLFAEDYRIAWFLPLGALAVLQRRRFPHLLFAALISAWLVYVLYVGGDRFEFRFLVVVFPYLYWLIADGLRSVAAAGHRGPPGRNLSIAMAAVVTAGLLLATHVGSARPESRGQRQGIAGIEFIRDYAARRAESGKFLRGWIEDGRLPDDVVLCVGGAGALPYYTRWPTIDRLGINDRTVARLPIRRRGVIAHERQAPYDYLLRRKVVILDVFNQILFEKNILAGRLRSGRYDGAEIPLRGFRLGERYLIFGTLVSDAELRRSFGELERVE